MSDGLKGLLTAVLGVGFIVALAVLGASFFGTPGGNAEPGYLREPDRR